MLVCISISVHFQFDSYHFLSHSALPSKKKCLKFSCFTFVFTHLFKVWVFGYLFFSSAYLGILLPHLALSPIPQNTTSEREIFTCASMLKISLVVFFSTFLLVPLLWLLIER